MARGSVKLLTIDLWRDADRAHFHRVPQELSRRGHDVVDLFVSPDHQPSFDAWLREFTDQALEEINGEPFGLLGYCAGGRIALELINSLGVNGLSPNYVGLIDTWQRNPLVELGRDLYGRYDVSWRVSVPQQIQWLLATPGHNWRVLLRAHLHRLAELPRRQARRRSRGPEWTLMHLIHDRLVPVVTHGVDLFVTTDSVIEHQGDASLGLAPVLRGGYVVHRIDGDHHLVATSPVLEELVALIESSLPNSHVTLSTPAS